MFTRCEELRFRSLSTAVTPVEGTRSAADELRVQQVLLVRALRGLDHLERVVVVPRWRSESRSTQRTT